MSRYWHLDRRRFVFRRSRVGQPKPAAGLSVQSASPAAVESLCGTTLAPRQLGSYGNCSSETERWMQVLVCRGSTTVMLEPNG
jgi:hypothetical protein